ncbi:MAG: NAD(+) synthase, partial [Lachnospiraceae bacterium]|nr:NAD(+) synthase [Lachnospiraceae bacterium]
MDAKKTKEKMIAWVRDYFKKTIPSASAVLGISGGKDSSINSSILKEALGKDKVVAVMMPDGKQADIEDSIELTKAVDLQNITVNIGPVTEAFKKQVNEGLKDLGLEMSRDAVINMAPRIRMAVLYAVAQSLKGGGLVANTCNLSEDYVGYATKFG